MDEVRNDIGSCRAGEEECNRPIGVRDGNEQLSITFERRKELSDFAVFLATKVISRTEPHERCLLRSMVGNLIADDMC